MKRAFIYRTQDANVLCCNRCGQRFSARKDKLSDAKNWTRAELHLKRCKGGA